MSEPTTEPNAWVLAVDRSKGGHFSTVFARRPKIIGLVRRFVADFHDEIILGDAPAPTSTRWASQLSLAAHELVENALQYGVEGETDFSIDIDPDPRDPENVYAVKMRTRNRADPTQHAIVTKMLEDLNAAEDPFAFYLALMADTANREQGSGLGLARVRVEAEMEVTCVVEGEEIEIQAQARVIHARGSRR
jgi:two-component sensor histidine kinase